MIILPILSISSILPISLLFQSKINYTFLTISSLYFFSCYKINDFHSPDVTWKIQLYCLKTHVLSAITPLENLPQNRHQLAKSRFYHVRRCIERDFQTIYVLAEHINNTSRLALF